MSDTPTLPLPVPIEEIPQEVVRFVGAEAPTPMRMMAARALVPLGPGHLITVLYLLCFDPDPQVVQAAQGSLGAIPDEVLRPSLSEPLPGAVLDYLARALSQSPAHLEVLLLNRRLLDETVLWLASVVGDRELEIIAGNQERLLRSPKIIEALYYNPKTRQSTLDRIIEMAVRGGIRLTGIPAFREIAAALGYRLTEEGAQETAPQAALDAAVASFAAELSGEEIGPSPREQDKAFGDLLLAQYAGALEEEAAGGKAKQGLTGNVLGGYTDVAAAEGGALGAQKGDAQAHAQTEKKSPEYQKMTAAQKIRLALLGNVSDRSQLVRDPKRLVAMAAIKSPKVQPNEVEGYAANAAIHGDVLRYIAANREWTRNYRLKLLLVQNPKCPTGNALGFLKHLRQSDLKSLSVNRNIPAVITSTARNLLRARSASGGKKK